MDVRGEHGSIPAGAGKPPSNDRGLALPRVHPRGRGEASGLPGRTTDSSGPSPRARGSRAGVQRAHRGRGSIPAGAGKPPVGSPGTAWYSVHPRGRGEARLVVLPDGEPVGPSPRARGSRDAGLERPQRHGSIPAGAGKPSSPRRWRISMRVHPRGRGEAYGPARLVAPLKGPSPRARGSRVDKPGALEKRGSIPAGAGKPVEKPRATATPAVHPRGRGEAHVQQLVPAVDLGPSPRARGSLRRGRRGHDASGSIPAGAGKPEPLAAA